MDWIPRFFGNPMDSQVIPPVSHSVQVDHGTPFEEKLNSIGGAMTVAKQMADIHAQAHMEVFCKGQDRLRRILKIFQGDSMWIDPIMHKLFERFSDPVHPCVPIRGPLAVCVFALAMQYESRRIKWGSPVDEPEDPLLKTIAQQRVFIPQEHIGRQMNVVDQVELRGEMPHLLDFGRRGEAVFTPRFEQHQFDFVHVWTEEPDVGNNGRRNNVGSGAKPKGKHPFHHGE